MPVEANDSRLPTTLLPQMSEPVMLEVCHKTTLRLEANPCNSSEYSFFVELEVDKSWYLPYAPVKIYVNDSHVATYQTTMYGYFIFHWNFDPGNTSVTYMVQAVYEGEGNQTAVLNGTSFDGKAYTRCTTMYCTYKPAVNMTQLTIEPEARQENTPTKTVEQMQAEAEDSGWLTVWHEWSWSFPWYRLHMKLAMNGATIDIGFTPILPICEVLSTSIPHGFIPPIPITTS